MKNISKIIGLILVVCFLCINLASGQQATEVYIPIGESPGVSGHASLRGVILSIDYATRSMEIQLSDRSRTVSMNDLTRYYLDRTGRRQSNSIGTLHDCESGRAVEVNMSGDGTAEWVKIEMR